MTKSEECREAVEYRSALEVAVQSGADRIERVSKVQAALGTDYNTAALAVSDVLFIEHRATLDAERAAFTGRNCAEDAVSLFEQMACRRPEGGAAGMLFRAYRNVYDYVLSERFAEMGV